jgi:hypothetical protein
MDLGLGLTDDLSLLIHGCQSSDDGYRTHVGWGHSGLSDAQTAFNLGE